MIRSEQPLAEQARSLEGRRAQAFPILSADEIERFLDLAQRLPDLSPEEVQKLTIVADLGVLLSAPAPKGLF